MIQPLGSFESNSGKLMVSDPCYEVGTWCQHELSNVKKGTWGAYVVKSDEGSWGVRCAELVAVYRNYSPESEWEHVTSDIGVDSGQAGIFDFDTYRNDAMVGIKSPSLLEERKPGNKWYNVCRNITSSAAQAGVLDGGVVSSSGYGDGSYDCYVQRNSEGEVVAVRIVFIGKDR